jgi:hypothetical protein
MVENGNSLKKKLFTVLVLTNSHMKYFLLFISVAIIFPIFSAHADDPKIACEISSYACYEKHVADICNAKDVQWWEWPDLWALKTLANTPYPELDKDKINATIASMENLEQANPTALQDGVSMSSIGSSQWFRIMEVARLMYRRNMNSIFSCGVISSRGSKLDSLNSILKGKQGASEILKSIEKERKRYETLKVEMSCDGNRPENSATWVVERVMKSSMKEYCRYTYYLDYLEANLREDFSKVSNIETKIGDGNAAKSAITTDGAQREIISRGRIIGDERTKANDVLPKAIVAFQEMDRTYIIHIMLTHLYDDYLKLRGQLNTYLATIGQTFEKAYNAQDDNQR